MKTKRCAFILFFVISASLCFFSNSFSQQMNPQESARWWTLGTPLQAREDAGISQDEYPAIVTVQGTILKLEDMRGVGGSEQMRLRTPRGETWVVFLGPKWFVDNQRIKFNPGDQVEVRGAKVLGEGESNIIAADVSKGDLTMKLRNDNGLPSWECCFPRASRSK